MRSIACAAAQLRPVDDLIDRTYLRGLTDRAQRVGWTAADRDSAGWSDGAYDGTSVTSPWIPSAQNRAWDASCCTAACLSRWRCNGYCERR